MTSSTTTRAILVNRRLSRRSISARSSADHRCSRRRSPATRLRPRPPCWVAPRCSSAVSSRNTDSRSRRMRHELVDVVPPLGQHPGDLGQIQPAVGRRDPELAAVRGAPRKPARASTSAAPARSATPDPGRLSAGGVEDLGHRALGQQPSAADDRDRVGDQLHLAQDVAGDQDRLAPVGEAAHRRPDLVDARRVESVGRLVEDQQVRVLEQGRGDGEPLLHAERVGPEPVLGRGRPAPPPPAPGRSGAAAHRSRGPAGPGSSGRRRGGRTSAARRSRRSG